LNKVRRKPVNTLLQVMQASAGPAGPCSPLRTGF
jgi:hypothetical protein